MDLASKNAVNFVEHTSVLNLKIEHSYSSFVEPTMEMGQAMWDLHQAMWTHNIKLKGGILIPAK